jgi:hypothetical protein
MLIKLKTGKRKGAILDVPFWVGKDQIRKGNATEHKPEKPARKPLRPAAPEKSAPKTDDAKASDKGVGKADQEEKAKKTTGRDGGRKMADKPDNKLLTIDKADK